MAEEMAEEENVETYPYGPNGPSGSKVAELKGKWGRLMLAQYWGNDIYVYRIMNRAEYSSILNEVQSHPEVLDDSSFEDFFVSKLLVWPEGVTTAQLKAKEGGLATSLYQQMSTVCKFNTISEPIEI